MGKSAKIYSEEIADQIGADLNDLAQHPKGLSTKEIIIRLLPQIAAAQDAGHTLEDIAEKFEKRGVVLKVNTLKRYLQECRSQLNSGSEAPNENTSEPTSATEKVTKPKRQKSSPVQKEKPKEPTEIDESLSGSEDGFQELRSDEEL